MLFNVFTLVCEDFHEQRAFSLKYVVNSGLSECQMAMIKIDKGNEYNSFYLSHIGYLEMGQESLRLSH